MLVDVPDEFAFVGAVVSAALDRSESGAGPVNVSLDLELVPVVFDLLTRVCVESLKGAKGASAEDRLAGLLDRFRIEANAS